jgi:hypothetical protein
MDLSGILNPKRVVEKRLEKAERTEESQEKEPQGARFGKPYTPEERMKQQKMLAEVLRRRK